MATTKVNGRDLVLLIDSVDRSDETTTVALNYGERQTFADMRGLTPKRLDMTITQDLASTSLFRMATKENPTSKTAVLKPLGNSLPTVEQPHYTFDVVPRGITGDTFMGGEAAEDASQALTVDVQWLIENWTEVTA